MMGSVPGSSVRSSVGLVWRHQRLVWWIFAVNLVLAFLGSLTARAVLSSVLNHSLESARLVSGFDLSSFILLMQRPDVSMSALAPGAVAGAFVFLVYLLFVDGGIFAVFLDDRKLSRAEFFENSGLYFWRMVRLALYSLLPFAILAALNGAVANFAEKLSNDAAPERLGFLVNVAGKIVVLLLMLFVRLCFDLTQARVVRDNERRLLRTLWRSVKLALRSGGLYAKYVGIGLYMVLVFTVGVAVWVYIPHSAMWLSVLVLELVTIKLIAARLWLKAVSARFIALEPSVPVTASTPLPQQEESPVPPIGVTDAPSSSL